MRFRILALGLFLISAPAYGQVAGQACHKFGQTIVAEDRKSVLACLRGKLGDPSSPLVWMLNTVAPEAWQHNGDADTKSFYTIGREKKAGE